MERGGGGRIQKIILKIKQKNSVNMCLSTNYVMGTPLYAGLSGSEFLSSVGRRWVTNKTAK